jgi:NADH-quinone oxidoreductase subunit C
VADEKQNTSPDPENPAPPAPEKPAAPATPEGAAPAAPPKPPVPPKPAGAAPIPPKPATPGTPAAPPKPKGPVPESWTSPLVDALNEKFGGEILKSYSFLGQNQIDVKKTRIGEIMLFLRDNSLMPFAYLVDETAVHWPKTEEFEIVYILYSFEGNERLRVKARVKEWEEIESVVSVWSTANWLEREVYDMFGVRYANHPDMRRILLPEDWVGFPLRKDYNIRLQDVDWVRKHLGIDSGQKYYVGEARHESPDYITPTD